MPSTLQLIQNITYLARGRLDLSRGLCPGASTPPLFAGLTAMDDIWDERILALEVSRLSRAAKARIYRAKRREAAEMASRTSSCRQQGQQKRARPRSESASLTLSKDCASSQARKRPKTAAAEAAAAAQSSSKKCSGSRSRPTASLRDSIRSRKGDSGKLAACAWDKVRLVASASLLTVGTECSGLESVMAALDQMGLGKQTRLRFICEKDAAARKLILAHRTPDFIYEDITERPVDQMPTCDIYAAGFPCQPWSAAGLREGANDRHGRGQIFPRILEYLRQKLPKCFLLENVKGLTSITHREAFKNMLASLRSGDKYIVSWRVLNTADYGIPQNRPRLYIIGLLRSACPAVESSIASFKWPRRTECMPLSALLDPDKSGIERQQPRPGSTAEKHLLQLQRQLAKQGSDAHCLTPYALDIFGIRARAVAGRVPCLTRTQARTGAFWITTAGGLLTTQEMLRLQSLPDHLVDTAAAAGVSDRQLRQMIGNAMSVNVLVLILSKLLIAMGLAAREP